MGRGFLCCFQQLIIYETRLFWYTKKELLEKSYRLVLGGFSKKKQKELLEGEKSNAV